MGVHHSRILVETIISILWAAPWSNTVVWETSSRSRHQVSAQSFDLVLEDQSSFDHVAACMELLHRLSTQRLHRLNRQR